MKWRTTMSLPFDLTDDIETRLKKIEQRLRNFSEKKYDMLGIDRNKKLRDRLFQTEMSVFRNQFLWRNTLRQKHENNGS